MVASQLFFHLPLSENWINQILAHTSLEAQHMNRIKPWKHKFSFDVDVVLVPFSLGGV